MNLCHPDSSKSCAACCGLYNVNDGRRGTLNSLLIERTLAFRNLSRTVAEICDFSVSSGARQLISQLDPEIHVCEYAGFVDDSYSTVGCMLHPNAPGNKGIDFRGLCHYGSMACKSFFCPASSETHETCVIIANRLITDWHLYGLVCTDINYMTAIFALTEMILELPIETEVILGPKPSAILMELLSWKTSWAFAEKSLTRRSAYYFKRFDQPNDESGLVNNIVDSLCFTFDCLVSSNEANAMVRRRVMALADSCKQEMIKDK